MDFPIFSQGMAIADISTLAGMDFSNYSVRMFDPVKANQPIIDAIAEFCGRHGLSVSRFGELALNDPAFVGQLKQGRLPSARTQFRVSVFMEQYQANTSGDATVGAAQ